MTAFTLNLEPLVTLTDDAFYALCQANPEVKFERTSVGKLIVMPPTGGETGNREAFPPLCPDFIVELRSPSDTLRSLQDKMQEYMDNGARLGWLINPKAQQVEIYRLCQEKEVLLAPTSLSGEQLLPGFVLNLKGIL